MPSIVLIERSVRVPVTAQVAGLVDDCGSERNSEMFAQQTADQRQQTLVAEVLRKRLIVINNARSEPHFSFRRRTAGFVICVLADDGFNHAVPDIVAAVCRNNIVQHAESADMQLEGEFAE